MSADLYARLGDAGIEQLVDRLYHWMEHLPEAHEAHRLHGPDLGEVKRRLGAFLSGWLGANAARAPARTARLTRNLRLRWIFQWNKD